MEKYLFIGLVIFGVFLFGCAGTSGTTNVSGVSGTATQKSSECQLTLQELKNGCIETCQNITAQQQNNSPYDMSIVSDTTKAQAAMISNNNKRCLENCDSLSETDVVTEKNKCYIGLAGKPPYDVAYCGSVTGPNQDVIDFWKDECYGGIAEQKSDPSFCGRIKDTSYRDDCYKYIKSE